MRPATDWANEMVALAINGKLFVATVVDLVAKIQSDARDNLLGHRTPEALVAELQRLRAIHRKAGSRTQSDGVDLLLTEITDGVFLHQPISPIQRQSLEPMVKRGIVDGIGMKISAGMANTAQADAYAAGEVEGERALGRLAEAILAIAEKGT